MEYVGPWRMLRTLTSRQHGNVSSNQLSDGSGWRWGLIICMVLLAIGARDSLRSPAARVPAALDPLSEDYPWLYLRDEKIPDGENDLIEIVAVGDLMLGRGVTDVDAALQDVAPWLTRADLAIGNLEGIFDRGSTVTSPTQFAKRPFSACNDCILQRWEKPIWLRMPMIGAAALQRVGFDVLGLANNHALDNGSAGLGQTVGLLHKMGIYTPGVGRTSAAAFQPVVKWVKGRSVAILAFTAIPPLPESAPMDDAWYVASWQWEEMLTATINAHSQYNITIISLHWGNEYNKSTSNQQQALAQTLTKAGADIVIGHHPHTVQKVEIISTNTNREALIAYSLGNFVFDQGDDVTRQGLAIRVFFDRQGLQAAQALPVWNYRTAKLMELNDAQDLFHRIQPESRYSRYVCNYQTCQVIPQGRLPDNPSELQGSGLTYQLVDLTGDGKPELVHKVGTALHIFQAGILAWSSSPEWQVVDFSTGDPNNDGRYEVMITLNKPNAAGKLVNHPFMIGYRAGMYRLIWGGSAVVQPIREIEVGDLDGDGEQELVVIEQHDSGKHTIGVWRWHGWGFSLIWRSKQGWFDNLQLVQKKGACWIDVKERYFWITNSTQ